MVNSGSTRVRPRGEPADTHLTGQTGSDGSDGLSGQGRSRGSDGRGIQTDRRVNCTQMGDQRSDSGDSGRAWLVDTGQTEVDRSGEVTYMTE